MANIAEILSNYPIGTILYSPAFGVVKLKKIRPHLAVIVTDEQGEDWEMLYDGRFSLNGECVLFPSKEERDWDLLTTTIKWNADLFGVEIKTGDEHFVISAQPGMSMSYHESVRYFEGNAEWKFPTKEQLKIVATNIDEVNEIIKANGGFEIRGWHWTADVYDEFCAWGVLMGSGYTSIDLKYDFSLYVRAVSALNN